MRLKLDLTANESELAMLGLFVGWIILCVENKNAILEATILKWLVEFAIKKSLR